MSAVSNVASVLSGLQTRNSQVRQLEDRQVTILQEAFKQVRDINEQIRTAVAAETWDVGSNHGTQTRGRGRPVGSKNSRARNDKPLREVIQATLKGNSGMDLPELVVAVKGQGYKSTSDEHFSTMVYQQVNKLMKEKMIAKQKDQGHLARYRLVG